MSERIPEGWKVSPLSALASVSWGNTSLTKDSYVERGFPAFSAAGNDGIVANAEYNSVGIVLSAIGARCGRTFLTPSKWTAIKNTITILTDKQDIRFLYQVFNFNEVWNKSGGAQPFISLSDAKKTQILHPPLSEQKKIASILNSVDDVIEKVQSQIIKLQDLKKSTMNELLTKGIGHKEFKDSELGIIPKSWEVVRFQEVFESYTYGPRFSSKEYRSNGNVKTIRGTDLTKDWSINYKQVPLAALDEKVVLQHCLKENDVVMITTADCGFSAVFKEQVVPFIASAYAVRLRPTPRINSQFCVWFLQTPTAKDQIVKYERKGTVSNLPGSDVMKMQLPLPSIREQSEIVTVLDSIDQNISVKKEKLTQTQSLKKSLMQDLLTGKVRVSIN